MPIKLSTYLHNRIFQGHGSFPTMFVRDHAEPEIEPEGPERAGTPVI